MDTDAVHEGSINEIATNDIHTSCGRPAADAPTANSGIGGVRLGTRKAAGAETMCLRTYVLESRVYRYWTFSHLGWLRQPQRSGR